LILGYLAIINNDAYPLAYFRPLYRSFIKQLRVSDLFND